MKKALTIGELLITMAIIGVIATLVLPSFIKDYHNKLYVTRLKKVYEMVDSAVNQACLDNNVSYFYQTPYHYKNGVAAQQEFVNKYFRRATNSGNPFAPSYRYLNSANTTTSPSSLVNSGWAKLQGGEAIQFFCWWETTYCLVRVDINSTDGPNMLGRDFFTIAINTHTNKLGEIYNSKGESFLPEDCTSGKNAYGHGCLERIIEDNWEMKY